MQYSMICNGLGRTDPMSDSVWRDPPWVEVSFMGPAASEGDATASITMRSVFESQINAQEILIWLLTLAFDNRGTRTRGERRLVSIRVDTLIVRLVGKG